MIATRQLKNLLLLDDTLLHVFYFYTRYVYSASRSAGGKSLVSGMIH
jgi:hypothetical protein